MQVVDMHRKKKVHAHTCHAGLAEKTANPQRDSIIRTADGTLYYAPFSAMQPHAQRHSKLAHAMPTETSTIPSMRHKLHYVL